MVEARTIRVLDAFRDDDPHVRVHDGHRLDDLHRPIATAVVAAGGRVLIVRRRVP